MDYKTTCLFLLTLLIYCIKDGASLQCYTCASPENSLCGREFSSSKVPTLPCPGTDSVCIKGKSRVGGDIMVTRTCGTHSSCQLFETCQVCTSDKCNSSTNLKIPFMLLPLIGLVLFKSYF
uniref:Ly-6/neurotoxin-related protein n=1 Tax=Pyrocoelia rufa TaxID=71223 RepID=A7LI76_PYRRU|nr:Ly-6/neurotoxin-related protein [Pyrocoelia rufa]ABS70976.1 Ly-6/neurotoxin-related protein [Pyrocoelia rufa]